MGAVRVRTSSLDQLRRTTFFFLAPQPKHRGLASDHPRKDENTDLEQEDDACDGNRKKHGVGGWELHASPRLLRRLSDQ
jgi:hypothetical protein